MSTKDNAVKSFKEGMRNPKKKVIKKKAKKQSFKK